MIKVILFLVFFSGYASAVDFVYRVDSRPPDEIFVMDSDLMALIEIYSNISGGFMCSRKQG